MTIPEHWGQHERNDLLTVKIVNDEAFHEYEGFDIAKFEDNSHDTASKVLEFYVPMGEIFSSFKIAVVKHLGLEGESRVRFWVFTDRMNETVRVEEAIDDNEVNSMSISRVWKWLAPNSEFFRLYIEVPSGASGARTFGGPDANSALIFLKYFDIPKQKLYGVGKMHVSDSNKLSEMFSKINDLMGWRPHRKLMVFEEVQPGLIGNLNAARSFSENDIQTGDIICFQESFTATEREILTTRHPGLVVDIAQFYAELHNPLIRKADATVVPRLLPQSFDFTISPGESFGDALRRVQERMGVLNKELANYRFICTKKDSHSVNAVTSFDSLINCAICMELLADPVAFVDCMHLACGACAVEWFKYSNTCHQCRQPVRSVRDSHATAAIVDAYRQSTTCGGRTDAELASLRTVYKPGQVIDLNQSDTETQPDHDWDDIPVEPERPYSEHGCPCCNPENQLDFLCPEPILDDDTNMVFSGHSRCADCAGHLPLIPEFNSTCCAVCTRFTCHELGLQCDSSEDLPVPFSLQTLKDVRFSKKLDTNLLKFIPIEHEREVLMKYARENDMSSQALFEKVLEHHSVLRGLPRASWHGVGQAPFDPRIVRVDDMICFSCARNILAANVFGWWRSLYATLAPTATFARSNWCPYGISCLRALNDELHSRASHHICLPAPGNRPNVIRSSTGASEGGDRMEYHTTTALRDVPFPFSPREVQFRERGGDPLFLCSVVLESEGTEVSTVPGKLVLRRHMALASYSLDEDELRHDGTIRVLVDTRNMRWVRISRGEFPPGCRPVLGGLDMRDETDVRELYHCAAWFDGQRTPGYTARGMKYAVIPTRLETYKIADNYDLLCWA